MKFHFPFGPSGMSPAGSASRAGVMPEASGDRKPVIAFDEPIDCRQAGDRALGGTRRHEVRITASLSSPAGRSQHTERKNSRPRLAILIPTNSGSSKGESKRQARRVGDEPVHDEKIDSSDRDQEVEKVPGHHRHEEPTERNMGLAGDDHNFVEGLGC